MDPRIADYIRANRRKYTRDAIRQQLIAAGHDPADIDATWAALDTPDPDAVAGEGFWKRFALILIGVNLAVFLLVALLTGMLQSLPGGGFILTVIFAVALAIGALIAWGLVAATGPTRMSPTTSLVIGAAIPLLFALLIGGTCYALVGALGGPPQPVYSGVIEADLGAPLDVRQSVDGSCQPNGPNPGDGFFVNGSLVGSAGQTLDINIGAYPPSPGGALDVSIWISSYFIDKAEERQLTWGNDGPSTGELDVSLNGINGTVRFTDLPAMQDDPGGNLGDPLSGEISWTCE